MARTPRPHPSYAALTALSAALLLGAALDAPMLASGRAPGTAVRLSAVDREALASLLSCLAEAARGLGEQKQAQAPTPAGPRALAAATPAPATPSHEPAPRASVIEHRPDLLNLPPPASA